MLSLEDHLLDAHDKGDGRALTKLYAQAADEKEALGDTEAACFYLTHAFVFALETGAPEEAALQARLHAYGREAKPRGNS